jgi:hypothetical protein
MLSRWPEGRLREDEPPLDRTQRLPCAACTQEPEDHNTGRSSSQGTHSASAKRQCQNQVDVTLTVAALARSGPWERLQ